MHRGKKGSLGKLLSSADFSKLTQDPEGWGTLGPSSSELWSLPGGQAVQYLRGPKHELWSLNAQVGVPALPLN